MKDVNSRINGPAIDSFQMLDADKFDPNEFPHFQVFCNIQLSRPATPTEHWENAVKIAAIPEDKIRTMTMPDCRELGITF